MKDLIDLYIRKLSCKQRKKVKIYVKNVKFGDCTIIENNDNILVVDCGSKNKGVLPCDENAYMKLEEHLLSEKNICQILVTHYHADHMNGIRLINKDKVEIEKIYLPYTFLREGKGEPWFHILCELFYIAPQGTYGFDEVDKISDFLKWLSDFDKSQIKCLKWKDEFYIGDVNNVVLWPRIDFYTMGFREYDGVKCIKKILVSLYEIIKDNPNIEHNIKKMLFSEYQTLGIYEYFKEVFLLLESDDSNSKELSQKIDQFYNAWREWRTKIYDVVFDALDDKDKEHVRRLTRMCYHRYIRNCNEMSIVFHEKDKEKYIFLGDISKRVINFLKNERDKVEKNIKSDSNNIKRYLYMQSEYQIIKVQHHGTAGYFTENMPRGKKYIISNGGYKRNKISLSLIQFIRNADNGHGADIFCTNGKQGDYCEYKQKYSCSECKGIDGDQKIIFYLK